MDQQLQPGIKQQEFKIAPPDGPHINPKNYVERGTGSTLFMGHLILWLFVIIISVATAGLFLLVMLFVPLINAFNRRKVEAALQGSALQVGPGQFREIYESAQVIAQRLGLPKAPDIYIVEDNTLNAAAGKIGSRNVVALIDDTVNACIMTGNIQSLNFILAHEIAHHALGHTGTIRSYLALNLKSLSRLDEFSCDRVAGEIVNEPNAAVDALAILLAGPQLYPYLRREALIEQAVAVEENRHSKKAEKTLTHPLMLRRIYRALGDHAKTAVTASPTRVSEIPAKSTF
jgi:Zn-dependent protease with chaperone function